MVGSRLGVGASIEFVATVASVPLLPATRVSMCALGRPDWVFENQIGLLVNAEPLVLPGGS